MPFRPTGKFLSAGRLTIGGQVSQAHNWIGSMDQRNLRIGFISTRLAGTDGVSLESAKWSEVLAEMGHTCFYFAGESDRLPERSKVVPEAHFDHPLVRKLTGDLFDDKRRKPDTSDLVRSLSHDLKGALHAFIRDFDLDLLLIENALAIPMHVPLGLALTELIAETEVPTIAHHHDFTWERSRFAVNAAEDYLQAAFPPAMPSIHHVVINSYAARQLALRTGMRSTIVPNVMDFDHPPPEAGPYADTLREALGMTGREKLLLQPTRIVPRKRIERAIELARWLEMPLTLVISHGAGDEGFTYQQYLEEYANVMGVRLILAEEIFAHNRGSTPDGRKVYSLADAYQQADLVTYPSQIEGFGNAFLEAVYYRRPLMMSRYEIFATDIQPKGFQVVGFDEFIDRSTIEHARTILRDPSAAEEMIETNYALGRRFFSYRVLRRRLKRLLEDSVGGTF